MIDLDKRILDGKKPLTAFDEVDGKFIGTDCYFSDKASDFGDLSNCQIGSLLREDEATGVFSATKNNSYAVFNYCLPAEWVKKEPKYRAFTNEEFFTLFDTGKLHSIRKKNERGRFIITEVYFNDDCEKDTVYVKLNHCDAGFAMRYLLRNDFEYFDLDGKEWKPFGIKE